MTSLPKALIRCQLYKAQKIPQHNIEEEGKFKEAIASINVKMGIATLLSNPVSEMVLAKFGSSPVGSTNSFQLSYTEDSFRVNINITGVPRLLTLNVDINIYPPLPMNDSVPRAYPDTVSRKRKHFQGGPYD